jgi:hypothetical protein
MSFKSFFQHHIHEKIFNTFLINFHLFLIIKLNLNPIIEFNSIQV